MRPLVVLLVLTVDAIHELNAPRDEREANLHSLAEFMKRRGVHVYAMPQDRAAVRDAINAVPDIEIRRLWTDIIGPGRRVKVVNLPPPFESLAELREDRDGWLARWASFADLVLLDGNAYDVFAGLGAKRDKPADFWFQIENLTVARAAHWIYAPPIDEANLRGVQIRPGLPREEVGETLFRVLIEHAADISLIDGYLGRGTVMFELGGGKRGELEWLLTYISEVAKAPPGISIFAPRDNRRLTENERRALDARFGKGAGKSGFTHAMIAEVVDEILERVTQDIKPKLPPQRVTLVDSALPSRRRNERDRHSRWIVFQGQAAVAIDAGLDVFRHEMIWKHSDVHFAPIGSEHYQTRLRDIETMARNTRTKWLWQRDHYGRRPRPSRSAA
jgi:hypothetical protein